MSTGITAFISLAYRRSLLWISSVLGFLLLLHALWSLASYQPQVLGARAELSASGVISLINLERTTHHLPALTPHTKLDQAALLKAQHMIGSGNFDHYYQADGQAVDPWQFITQAGYDYYYAGENLARHFHDSRQLVQAWMASSAHKANLLNPFYTHVGLAIVDGPFQTDASTNLIVLMLASPLPPGLVAADSSPQPERLQSTSLVQGESSPPAPAAYSPWLIAVTAAGITIVIGLICLRFFVRFGLLKLPPHDPRPPQSSHWKS